MFLLRQFIFSYVFSRRLEKRDRSVLYRILSVLMIIAASALFEAPVYLSRTAAETQTSVPFVILSTVFFCTVSVLLMALWVSALYNVKRYEAIYTAVLGYLAEHSEYALQMIREQYLPSVSEQTLVIQAFKWVLVCLYAFFIDRIFAEHIIKDRHYRTQTWETACFLVVSGLVVMVLSAMASQYGFAGIHGIYAFIFCIFALATQIERQNALSEQQKYEVRESLLMSQNAQFESYMENIELVNRKCHDLKHQVSAIKQMRSEESRDKALSEIENAVMIYDSFIRTGCDILDTILTQKNHICMENDILFTCVVDGGLLIDMDPVDLYTVFGNMLDNAIEATEKLPKERRSISLSTVQKMGAVIISEENPYDRVDIDNGQFTTTKQDKVNHGYGLRSIELAVEKYDCSMDTRAEDGIFKMTIALPMLD